MGPSPPMSINPALLWPRSPGSPYTLSSMDRSTLGGHFSRDSSESLRVSLDIGDTKQPSTPGRAPTTKTPSSPRPEYVQPPTHPKKSLPSSIGAGSRLPPKSPTRGNRSFSTTSTDLDVAFRVDMSQFQPHQIPAATQIIEHLAKTANAPIPAVLIVYPLVSSSEAGKGLCLIGDCHDEERRRRIDHLLYHVRDKHFSSRPFVCSLAPWYARLLPCCLVLEERLTIFPFFDQCADCCA